MRKGGHVTVARSGSAARLRRRLTLAYQALTQRSQRSSSLASINRGIRDYRNFTQLLGEDPLPAPQITVANYLVYSVTIRPPAVLDSSTVLNYATGQSYWHDQAREITGLSLVNPYKTKPIRRLLKHMAENFKKPSKAKQPWSIAQMRRMLRNGFKPTRSGKHQKLCLMFSNLGILRKNASRRLIIKYDVIGNQVIYHEDSGVKVNRDGDKPFIQGRVYVDKNVTARKQREFFIPHKVRRLGVRPVDFLESYLINERPPSGGYLLAAPIGATGFRDTPYGNHGSAFVNAYKAAFPNADDSKRFGSGSARKAMAQWLWSAGWAKRVIADAGGWFSKKSAVDLYFKTEPKKIMFAIRNVGRTCGQNRR